MSDDADWVRDAVGGSVLRVHVRPGAARSGLAGFHGGALCARVAARPVEGAANRALTALLAGVLGVRPGALAIVAGEHGRDKGVHVRGLAPSAVRARVDAALDVDKGRGGH